jgi:hypothetical protein
MKITNHNNQVVSLNVNGYRMAQEKNGFDSDWLDAEIIVSTENGDTKVALELFIVEEIERMIHWLEGVKAGTIRTKRLEFVDPNMVWMYLKKAGKPVLKVLITTDKETRTSIDIILTEATIETMHAQLNAILINYPCRCGQPHETITELGTRIPFSLCYDDYPDIKALGFVPRTFKGGYKDSQDLFAGNLYAWLHQTKCILWKTDRENKRITFYTEPITKLGRRMATLERIDQEYGERIMMELVYLLSFKEMKSPTYNWHTNLTADDSKIYHEVLDEIGNQDMKNVLLRFMKMFVKG